MAQIIRFAPNKSVVERMEEVVYTLQVRNNLAVSSTIRVTFSEIRAGGEVDLNYQTREIGPGATESFTFTFIANQGAGHVYTTCALTEDLGFGGGEKECSTVEIRAGSEGIVITGFEADKTHVDGGATVRYVMGIENRTLIAQYIYVQFWDIDLDEVLYENEMSLAAGAAVTFEHLMVCGTLGRAHRVCGRLVSVHGNPIGNMACAKTVQVSNTWGSPVYVMAALSANPTRIEMNVPVTIVASVSNTGTAGGSPMVDIEAYNTETGESIDLGSVGAYVIENTTTEIPLTTYLDAEGVFEITATIRGTAISKTVSVGVGRDLPSPTPTPGSSSGFEIPPLAIVAAGAVAGGALLYFLGPKYGFDWDVGGL